MPSSALNILLVEDNPADADLLEEILSDASGLSWQMTHVDCLHDALATLRDRSFDVVLLDLSLPDSQGLGSVTRIQAQVPHLAIVVLTGLASEEVGLEALRQGVQDYLIKGQLDEQLLARTIRYASERSRTQQLMQRQAAAMAASRDGIAILDINLCLTYVNQAFADIYGYPHPEELIGRSWRVLYQPSELAILDDEILPLVHAEGNCQRELIGKQRNGRLFSQDLSLTQFGQNELVCVVRDISDRKQAEETLRILQYSLDQVNDAVYLTQKDARFFYVNQAACRSLGYRLEEFNYLTVHDLDPNYPAAYWPQHWDALEVGKSYVMESTNMTCDGREIPVELSSNLLNFDGREFKCTIVRDISDRKRSELAIRQSEEKFRQLAENIHDAFFLLSANSQTLLYISPGYEDIWGQSCPCLQENPIACLFDSVARQDQDWVRHSFKRFLRDRIDFSEEFPVIRPDNTTCWVWMRAAFVNDDNGQPYRIAGIAEDISDRKRVETALQDQFNFLQVLIDTIPSPIFYKDIHGVYLGCNRAFEAALDLSSYDIMGKTASDLFPEPLAQQYLASDQTLLDQGETQIFESVVQRRDGTQRDVVFYKAIFFNADQTPAGIVGTILDITERKRAEADMLSSLEREKELNDLKSRFITTTSHEFRTPLTTILSAAELLELTQHKLTDAKRDKYYSQIKNSVQHMIQLLDDILVMSSYEAGQLSFHPHPLDLESFCNTLVEGIHLNLRNSSHAIEFTLHQESEIQQIGQPYLDEKLLRHILSNLISNAVKYSPPGSVIKFDVILTQSPSYRSQVQPQWANYPSHVIFRVQDSGIGIPEEDRDRLFEPFHRAKNIGNTTGTGLGLSIVKTAVDLYNGTISVESEMGKGSVFTVTLPLKYSPPNRKIVNQSADSESDAVSPISPVS